MIARHWFPAVLIFSFLMGCARFPLAPPQPGITIPLHQETALGEEAYREILKHEQLSQDPQLLKILNRVGGQLAAVSPMSHLNWEFALIESNERIAFALPGGKVAVTTGMLPVCANEAGLAAVLSHQIAHVVARHGAERLPRSFRNSERGAATPVGLLNSRNKNDILLALGVGQDRSMPFSQSHEIEADDLGMKLMVQAGYDPMEAFRFWNRINQMRRGSRVPEMLFTHPIDARRLEDLRRLLPKANRAYQANPLKHGLGQSILYLLSRRKLMPKPNSLPQPPAQPSVKTAPAPGTLFNP
ncbi:MAG: M48 family metallopeptidase [Nitrospinae bacterium]|nr:M48 family metallopeptidase [Nitrospinota bacterium]